MKRRTLLRGLGAAGTLALTGCLSDGSGGQPTDTDEPTATDTPSDDPANTDRPAATPADRTDDTVTEPAPGGTDDPSATPSDSPDDTVSETPDSEPSATPSGVADRSFEVTDSDCGAQTDDASVTFDEDGGTVTVTGTIWGADACYTAVLSDVRLDGGTLTVVVDSESDAETDTMCAECITEIGYEATVELDDALPGTVAVLHSHDGEDARVTSRTR